MSVVKTRKLDTLAKLFQAMRSRTTVCADKAIGQLLKLENQASFKKLSRWITKTLNSKYSFALSAH